MSFYQSNAKVIAKALLGFAFMIASCNDDSSNKAHTNPSQPATITFNLDDKPNIKTLLEGVLGQTLGNDSVVHLPSGDLKISEGVAVDSAGYAQYAFEYLTTPDKLENLVILKSGRGLSRYIMQFEPDKTHLATTDGLWTLEDFTGYARQLDLDRRPISEARVVNGRSAVYVGSNESIAAAKAAGSDPLSCCWATVKSTATNLPMVLVTCDSGSGAKLEFIMYGLDWGRGRCAEPSTENFQNIETEAGSTFEPYPYTGETEQVGGKGGSKGSTAPATTAIVGVIDKVLIQKQVESLLAKKPTALLNIIDCKEIEAWKNVAAFKPPAAVVDKLKKLKDKGNDFDILALQDAGGVVVNMDYFSVTIQKLPKTVTADQLYNYMRLNINNLVDTDKGHFTPSTETGINEAALWQSTNPVGTVMHIAITPDDGSVVCTDYTSSSWKFTTIITPEDGTHPVSGTREFGYTVNPDGSYTFYTRGVDRYTERIMELAAATVTLDDRFYGADALWKSFQTQFSKYLESLKIDKYKKDKPVTMRPDWNKIKDVLLGRKPVSSLNCRK